MQLIVQCSADLIPEEPDAFVSGSTAGSVSVHILVILIIHQTGGTYKTNYVRSNLNYGIIVNRFPKQVKVA